MALNVLHLSIDRDNISDNNCNAQSNKNRTSILSILINNDSLFNQIINFLKLGNNNIFIHITKLLIELFDSDLSEFQMKIKDKKVFDIYLNFFDSPYVELDEISVNFIFEFYLNYFKYILTPLQLQNYEGNLDIIIREDLKKTLDTCKNVFLLSNQDIRIKIITFIGNLNRSFYNSDIFIEELINSKIIEELFINLDLNFSVTNVDSLDLYFHLLFKILEFLTSQSKTFLSFLLHELKIVDLINLLGNKFNIEKSVKKAAYRLLLQLSLVSKDDAYLLLDCLLIFQIQDELSLANNDYEISVVKCILKILNVLLDYEDTRITQNIYSKELLIALFELIYEENEIINDIIYVEILINIIEKLKIPHSIPESQNSDSSVIRTKSNFMEDMIEINGFEKFKLLIRIFEEKILNSSK